MTDTKKQPRTATENQTTDGEEAMQLDNTPFGWVNALRCDDLEREDQRSQCEYDGFTLQQQLGGFGEWVETNPRDREVYAKDYRRLRRDRCNLFQREDLQTACKREPLGKF